MYELFVQIEIKNNNINNAFICYVLSISGEVPERRQRLRWLGWIISRWCVPCTK